MIEEINEPFRLKGRASEEVRPFDPIAVKELLVNALVHRDHDSDEPVRLRRSFTKRVMSP
jgi:predicted HTH transcriptional regulator